VEYKGEQVILKDYGKCSALTKTLWGKTLINNEAKILRHLASIKGIPRLVSQTDTSLATEYIAGQSLGKLKGRFPYEIIPKIESLISTIHRRGVVHLDLAQKQNILLAPDMTPYLIDFANAFYFRKRAFGFRQAFDYLCLVDRGSLLKFKNRYFPDRMTAEDRNFLKWFWRIRRLWVFNPKTFRASDKV
jgi:predicted Ser/Thr protein kinase